MRAAVLKQYGSPLTVEEVDDPVLSPNDVMVRVKACSLCGSDLKIASGKFPGTTLPHIPGHEIAGEVYKVGDQVTKLSAGDNVVVYFYVTCGVCRYCKSGNDSLCENLRGHIGFNVNGGMAEFLSVPSSCLIPFGSSISFTHAALMPDAIATSYHALRTQGKLKKGEVAVVIGIGGLGLHAVQIAKALGATVIAVDIDDHHLEKAS
ncbi:MAG: alcohol dehydrogenase catalytic domain-containing protein [Chloroflexi bacterium]|nr:alcohol dehydrogenase catalytic domain-containing protein [Chloroflexota bacterium]